MPDHDWRIVKETDDYRYQECKRCGRRVAFWKRDVPREAVDAQWVVTGLWSASSASE